MSTFTDLCNLEGRVALITGASSWGIGGGAARLLAQHGAKVFLVARREEKLLEITEEIESAGGEAGFFAADVSVEEQCKASVEACLEKFGRLDIMVLSAGQSGKGEFTYDDVFDTENYRNIMGVNMDGVWWMIKYGAKECAKGGVGSIIPIESLAGYTAAGFGPYTGAKGALRSWEKYLAKKLAPMGVRVNGVAPGFVRSDMTIEAAESEEASAFFMSTIPLRRFGEIEDIANAVLFLASDASSWMTGQTMIIDGGQLCG